jgi:Fur family iron response transcriptional regulator
MLSPASLRQVAIDSSKSYFDTNNGDHHHFYVVDISPTDVFVANTAVPPKGYEIARVDVVVRVRRKLTIQVM